MIIPSRNFHDSARILGRFPAFGEYLHVGPVAKIIVWANHCQIISAINHNPILGVATDFRIFRCVSHVLDAVLRGRNNFPGNLDENEFAGPGFNDPRLTGAVGGIFQRDPSASSAGDLSRVTVLLGKKSKSTSEVKVPKVLLGRHVSNDKLHADAARVGHEGGGVVDGGARNGAAKAVPAHRRRSVWQL